MKIIEQQRELPYKPNESWFLYCHYVLLLMQKQSGGTR